MNPFTEAEKVLDQLWVHTAFEDASVVASGLNLGIRPYG